MHSWRFGLDALWHQNAVTAEPVLANAARRLPGIVLAGRHRGEIIRTETYPSMKTPKKFLAVWIAVLALAADLALPWLRRKLAWKLRRASSMRGVSRTVRGMAAWC